MGITRHQHPFVPFGQSLKRVEQAFGTHDDPVDLAPQVDPQVDQHLIVPRTPAVYLLAGVPDFPGKHQFDLGMDVLHIVLDTEFAGFHLLIYGFQFALHVGEFGRGEQPDGFEHPGVGQRTEHVRFGQVHVHLAVATDGETIDFGRCAVVFLPEFHQFRIIVLSQRYDFFNRARSAESPGFSELPVSAAGEGARTRGTKIPPAFFRPG